MIQMLFLIFIISCTETPEDRTTVEYLYKGTPKIKLELDFVPDSSYLEYWCSIEVLEKTSKSIRNLELINVSEFLASFHSDCSKKTKFAKWSNKLLFDITREKPDMILQILDKNSSLDKQLILKEFESPAHDAIDIDEIVRELNKSKNTSKIKIEILTSLKKAYKWNKNTWA